MSSPPQTRIDNVTDVLHNTSVSDPYRWLEDQKSGETRAWLAEQSEYARSYLGAIPGRDRISNRVHALLSADTVDSLLIAGEHHVFLKRSAELEQPSIYIRSGPNGPDQLLLDPNDIAGDPFTFVRPMRLSPDGKLLLVEIKHGGERMGCFEVLDIPSRKRLPDVLPHGYLRGFAFSPDSQAYYYVHEPGGSMDHGRLRVRRHTLGTSLEQDSEIFAIGGDGRTRLHIVPSKDAIGFIVHRLDEGTYTDFYLLRFGHEVVCFLRDAEFRFGPIIHSNGRIFAMTDRDAPNFRIVEVVLRAGEEVEFVVRVAEDPARIDEWGVTNHWIYVSYIRPGGNSIKIFNLEGKQLRELLIDPRDSVRIVAASVDRDELFLERESFTVPRQIYRYPIKQARAHIWNRRTCSIAAGQYRQAQVQFKSKDGTTIPMLVVGRRDVLAGGAQPTIMTSYGGFGVSTRPRFSVLVMLLMERGCLFALPRIRGGSDFGTAWHEAARRRHRQVAFDDFLAAAEWLTSTGRTDRDRLAIFGGSNSALLAGAAMTQRPDLFRAVLLLAPLLDMLRYHRFDQAWQWRDELGTADDPEDFEVLARYSPYHNVRNNTEYPATMIISGDRDQNCNSMHARKMTARLQAANARSSRPILLDYSPLRGHSPVLPLGERIRALTDRVAFLCKQLGLEG